MGAILLAMTAAAARLTPSAAIPAWAGPPSHEVLRVRFEPDPHLPSELPQGFYRVLSRDSNRPDLPPFGRVGVSDETCAEGGWSLAFDLAGGGMCVATAPSVVPVGMGEIVEASTQVLAPGVVRSAPALVVRALDAHGDPIAGGAWRASCGAAQGWQRLEVRSAPLPAGSVALEVALEVAPTTEGDPTGDVSGRVFFDDLSVWRLPRVAIEVDRGGEGLRQAPRAIRAMIADPIGGAGVTLSVKNQDGMKISEGVVEDVTEFTLPLGELPPGAYEAQLLVQGDHRMLASATRVFGVVAPESMTDSSTAPAAERGDEGVRFGVRTSRPLSAALPGLAASVRLIRPEFVVIDIGDPGEHADGRATRAEMRRWIDDLRRAGIEPVLAVTQLPADVAKTETLEADDVGGLISRGEEAWRPVLGPWLEDFGHVVPHWIISRGTNVPAISAAFHELVPGFASWTGKTTEISSDPGASRALADSAAFRAIQAWQGGAHLIELTHAIAEEPGSAALGWRTLAAAARGARSVASLEGGSGVQCLLLSRSEGARVLAWPREGTDGGALVLPFDGSLTGHDLFGTDAAISRERGAVVVQMGSSPLVIDGVDATLGAFLSAIHPVGRLEGSTAEQTLTISFTNPWDVTLEGAVRFVAPTDWGFVPRHKRFSLPPGGSGTVSTQVTLPRTQPVGEARVGIDFEFTADRGYSLRVDPPLTIAVDAFACSTHVRRLTLADGRPSAMVELTLENHSPAALELESTVAAPDGVVRRDGPVRIEPGATARRAVRLDGAQAGDLLVTVGQTNGPLRLVQKVR